MCSCSPEAFGSQLLEPNLCPCVAVAIQKCELPFQITWTARAGGEYVGLRKPQDYQEVVVSYLPLSHVAAQMIDIWLPVTFGVQTCFAQPDALKVEFFMCRWERWEQPRVGASAGLCYRAPSSLAPVVVCTENSSPSSVFQGTLVETLKEVRPTAFMGVPRVWEKMEEKMKSVGAKSSSLKKRIAMWAKLVGLETNLKRMHG